jgi:copper chaperone CopZ
MNSSSSDVFKLSGLHCGKCVAKVTAALQPFAQDVKVSLHPMQVQLTGLQQGVRFNTLAAAVSGSGAYF